MTTTAWRAFRDYENIFWTHVNKSDGCWLWSGSTNQGRGQFNVMYRGRKYTVAAHVFSWVVLNGPVPGNLELDHTCNNKLCVRPDHLEPVTHRENLRRARERSETCNAGHRWDEQIPVIEFDPRYGINSRRCRVCRDAKRQERYSQKGY
jgi:hypothetical protein